MPCSVCGGSGKLPLIKNGKVIPYAWIFCECREEHYNCLSLKPEDFDFPMSYDCYRALCREHNWNDPGSNEVPVLPSKQATPQNIVKPVTYQQQAPKAKGVSL